MADLSEEEAASVAANAIAAAAVEKERAAAEKAEEARIKARVSEYKKEQAAE